MARPKKVYAYVCNEYTNTIHFTLHNSRFHAEKYYGDLQRRWKGSARSDVDLTVYESKEELEKALGADYRINWKEKTMELKDHNAQRST